MGLLTQFAIPLEGAFRPHGAFLCGDPFLEKFGFVLLQDLRNSCHGLHDYLRIESNKHIYQTNLLGPKRFVRVRTLPADASGIRAFASNIEANRRRWVACPLQQASSAEARHIAWDGIGPTVQIMRAVGDVRGKDAVHDPRRGLLWVVRQSFNQDDPACNSKNGSVTWLQVVLLHVAQRGDQSTFG